MYVNVEIVIVISAQRATFSITLYFCLIDSKFLLVTGAVYEVLVVLRPAREKYLHL